MAIYYLSDYLEIAYKWSQDSKRFRTAPLESQLKAIDLFKKTVRGDIGLSAVQGPPGTGKTSVFDLGLRDIWEEIVGSAEKPLLLYVAPTNHLVVEAFTRFTAQLFYEGLSPYTVMDLIRVYGSKIAPCRRDHGIIRIGEWSVECSRVKQLMGNIDPDHVRFVFATEYQRISPRIVKEPSEVRYVVDEASKTPYYRVFLPMARRIIRNPEAYYPRSMIVLGDPRQAIAVQSELRIYRIDLLMEYVEKLLENHGLHDECFAFLDTTFRLPDPTHLPISNGFYEGRLNALESYINRARRYRVDQVTGLDVFDQARNMLSKVVDLSKTIVERVVNGIEDALSSKASILVFNTKKFIRGDTYHPQRVKIAYVAGLYISILSQIITGSPLLDIGVTAPYSDLAYGAGYYVRKKLRELSLETRHVKSVTVQSIIGGESDVIITMLGKEWLIKSSPYLWLGDPSETMYYREPEVMNVQLSRHRLSLMIIGDINTLRYSARRASRETISAYQRAGKWISGVVDTLDDLQQRGSVVVVNAKNL